MPEVRMVACGGKMSKKRKPQKGVCGHCGRATLTGNEYDSYGKLSAVRCDDCCETIPWGAATSYQKRKPGNP